MYSAPSVSYPVGRCAFQRNVLALHSLGSAGLWLAWGWLQPFSWLWLGTGAVLGIVALCSLRALRQPLRLQWDASHWQVHMAQTDQLGPSCLYVGEVKPVLDLQSTLLLQWQPLSFTLGRSGQWLWVTQSACPELWLDLRRAVFAPSSTRK